MSKYSSNRDAALHFLCNADWANASFGDVQEIGAYVWRISNKPADVQPSNTEINSVLEGQKQFTDSPELRNELVGHFLVAEDELGFVGVAKFPSEAQLIRRFETWQKAVGA